LEDELRFALEREVTDDATRQGHRLAADADPRPAHAALAHQGDGDALRGGRCDGKADALRRKDHGGVDADDATPRVDERPARVSWIERGIRLQDVVHEAPGPCAHRATQRAHDACRDGVLEAVGAADRDGDLPDAQSARIAECAPMVMGRADLEDGEIGVRIVTDDIGSGHSSVRQRDLDCLGAAGNVAVREEIAVGRDQKPGSRA